MNEQKNELRIKAIFQVIEKGRAQKEVAAGLGVTPQTLSRWVIAARHKPHSIDDPEEDSNGSRPSDLRIASIIFGVVLKKLRGERAILEEKVIGFDAFAARLGISTSTLRNLESAQQGAPQPTLAHRLTSECKLFFPNVLLVIGFIHAFDGSRTRASALSLADELRRTEPRLGFFADHLKNLLLAHHTDRHRTLKEPSTAERLISLMKVPIALSAIQNGTQLSLLGELSPVLVDAVLALGDKLQMFQPVLDEAALGKWEEANSQRIKRVFGYYSDPNSLLQTIDAFPCKYLRTSTASVKYILLIKDGTGKQIEALKAKLFTKLSAKNLSPDAIFIHAMRSGTPEILALDGLLNFDIVQSIIADYTNSTVTKMTTLNIYELDTTSYSGSGGTIHCAFVDNSVAKINENNIKSATDQTFFARALKNGNTNMAVKTLLKITEALGVEL